MDAMAVCVVNRELARAGLPHKARYAEAEDETVDDEIEITLAGQKTPVAIQVALYAGGYCVNVYEFENGELVSMVDRGTYRTVAKAARIAAKELV